MSQNKIVRSICYFTDNPNPRTLDRINQISEVLRTRGYTVQTKRVCATLDQIDELERIPEHASQDEEVILSVGNVNFDNLLGFLERFYRTDNLSFNVDLTSVDITQRDVNTLFEIMGNKPGNTFNFAYVFNNPSSSPYFPAASYKTNGFSLGLQPTNLSEGCDTLEQWLENMQRVWQEIHGTLIGESDYLGIDSSIAPDLPEKSSFIGIARRLYGSFSRSVASDMYLRTSGFIKEQNPRPVGLCGLMFPCLEDSVLAEEYERGNFPLERNVLLSLNSGVGIDTYPIGIDEKPYRVLEILRWVQGLSNKYDKPLSARFVTDGKARIGERTDFQNQYLRDVAVRSL